MSDKSEEGPSAPEAHSPNALLARFAISFLLLNVLCIATYRILLGPVFDGIFPAPVSGVMHGLVYLFLSVLVALAVLRRPLRRLFRGKREAEESLKRIQEALAAAGDGIWVNNFMFARDYHSDEVFEMLGFEPLEPYDTFWLFQERMHPDDRRLWEAANTAIQKPGNDLYEVKVRVRHKNGEWRRIWVRGRCLERTDHGAPARMIGTYTDITVQSRHEDWLAGALSALRLSFLAVPIPIAVVSTDWRIAISNNLWRDSASRFGLGGFPNTDGGEPNMAQAADSESDCYRLTAAVQSLFEGQSGNFELLLRGNGPGGQALAEVVAGAIKNDARIVGAVLICRELTGTSAQKQETGPSMYTLVTADEMAEMAEAVLSDSDRAEAVWNVKADAFFGRGEREGHGQEPVLTGRLDEELFWRACERAAAGERIERFRVECVKPDGARVEAALWITPPAESAPVNQGPFVQVPDVRGEIQDESRSPVSNKELEFILGHVPLAILFIEPRSQTIIDSSSSVTALFGYLPGQLAGKSVKILFRGKRDYAAGKAAVRAALEAQVVTRGTHHMRDKSGRGFNGKVTVVPGTEFGEAAGRVMLIVQEIPGQ